RSMMRLDHFEFAVFASIWAMVPWSGPGVLVGVPFGIISLVMLLRPNIKTAFARNALRSRSRLVAPPAGRQLEIVALQAKGIAAGLKATAILALIQWLVVPSAYLIPEIAKIHRHSGSWPTWETDPELFLFPALGLPLVLIAVGILLSGARRLSRFENYGFLVVVSIWAMLPWSMAFVVGLPVGIWTLMFLRRPDVRFAFIQRLKAEGMGHFPPEPSRPGGFRSMLLGMQSLFLGSRATAAYLF